MFVKWFFNEKFTSVFSFAVVSYWNYPLTGSKRILITKNETVAFAERIDLIAAVALIY